MRIAITGGRGQLGRVLEHRLSSAHEIIIIDSLEFDITQQKNVESLANASPDLVIHAAAMTDVDACARDPMESFRVNALGTQNVALACQRARAVMLYLSTNEVFDGEKGVPYLELDEPHPLSPYAASKLAGERYVQMLLDRFYIVRTAWLYARGGNNFPKKMMDAAAGAHRDAPLRVVTDEIGNPTYAPDLAHAIAQLIETNHFGIYHLVNEGFVSRYDFTARILKLAGMSDVPLTRITLAEFKRDSIPPKFGVLANFAAATMLGIKLRNWEDALEEYFKTQRA